MRKKFISICSSVVLILLLNIGCGDKETVISPTHYDRVPKPVNLSAVYDTTATGKYFVSLNWSVNSTNNLKDFEIYRAYNEAANFNSLPDKTTNFFYTDSSLASFTDSLNVFYYVVPIGTDRFIGQASDILQVRVVKFK